MNTMIEMRPSSIGVAIAIEKVRDVVDAILEARAVADQSIDLKLFLYNDRMNSRAVVQAALAKVSREKLRKGQRYCALDFLLEAFVSSPTLLTSFVNSCCKRDSQ